MWPPSGTASNDAVFELVHIQLTNVWLDFVGHCLDLYLLLRNRRGIVVVHFLFNQALLEEIA